MINFMQSMYLFQISYADCFILCELVFHILDLNWHIILCLIDHISYCGVDTKAPFNCK